jgi:hypothetical protein
MARQATTTTEDGTSIAKRAHVGELDPRFSSPDAKPTPWAGADAILEAASTYWLSTVRPDGRPHVTTIAAVWLGDAVHFVTGRSERKARNVDRNRQVVVTTGCNGWEGLDIVIEGEAIPVTDAGRLGHIVESFRIKYDDFFGFRMADGRLQNPNSPDEPVAYEVRARKTFAFGKGSSFSQTRWRWDADLDEPG